MSEPILSTDDYFVEGRGDVVTPGGVLVLSVRLFRVFVYLRRHTHTTTGQTSRKRDSLSFVVSSGY